MYQANTAHSAIAHDGNPQQQHRHYGTTGRHWRRQFRIARKLEYEPGDVVRWTPDNDTGTVTGVAPDGLAVAIRWDSTGRIEWYSDASGALSFIERAEEEREEAWP